jgi:hypothetical protein
MSLGKTSLGKNVSSTKVAASPKLYGYLMPTLALYCIVIRFPGLNIFQFKIIVIKDVGCSICEVLYTTQSPKDQRYPQKFCEKSHIFCRQCCSRMVDCPICQAKQITSMAEQVLTFIMCKLKHKHIGKYKYTVKPVLTTTSEQGPPVYYDQTDTLFSKIDSNFIGINC